MNEGKHGESFWGGYYISNNVPELFHCADELPSMLAFPHQARGYTYLAAGNAGAQWIIAHADFFVSIRICKVVFSASHGADKDGNRVRRR